MACLNVLKVEIRSLESAFPRTHPRLQIVSASVDELTCRFIDPSGRKHTIHANITVGSNNIHRSAIFIKISLTNIIDLDSMSEYSIASCSQLQ